MDRPFLVVNHAVEYFYYQWNCGVQPCLTIKTQENGSILVSTTVSSEIPADPPFLPFQQTRRHCSGHGSRARRREVRNKTPHRSGDDDVMQPVTNNNNDTGIASNFSTDQSVQVEQELMVNDATLETEHNMHTEEELEKCRNMNTELTSQIEACQLEIERKLHQIRKLELEVSNLKFSSFKPPKKLSIANVERTDIPPSCR